MRTNSAMAQKPSPTREDYIRAIYLLTETAEEPGITQIAEKLQLSKSSVSERVKELTKDGFTDSKPYSTVSLTKKGLILGKKMTYKHRLIEVFLHDTLKLPAEAVHAEAELLEHACSDKVIKHLADFLGNPTHDPHGSPLKQSIL